MSSEKMTFKHYICFFFFFASVAYNIAYPMLTALGRNKKSHSINYLLGILSVVVGLSNI